MWRVRSFFSRTMRRFFRSDGSFAVVESSERASRLTSLWEANWTGAEPMADQLRFQYEDRWVRFHSLPDSKEYAETPDEHAELIRRHLAVLAELFAHDPTGRPIVIAEDYDWQSFHAGWTRQYFPGAWPWRIFDEEPDRDPRDREFLFYFWVRTTDKHDELRELLRASAEKEHRFIVSNSELTWLYCPYHSGVDIILPDTASRDALRLKFRRWLPQGPDYFGYVDLPSSG